MDSSWDSVACLLLPKDGPQDARRKDRTRSWNSYVLFSAGMDVFIWGIVDQTRCQATMALRETKCVRAHETSPLAFKLTARALCLQETIFKTLESDPLFARSPGTDLPLDKQRELNFLRCKRIFEYDFFCVDELLKNFMKVPVLLNSLGMYDWSLATKCVLHFLVSV